MLEFKPLSLDDMQRYNDLYNLCDEKCSDYTFINLWSWKEKYNVYRCFDGDICWLASKSNNDLHFLAPIGNWHQENWAERLSILGYDNIHFKKIPRSLLNIFEKTKSLSFRIICDRNDWEYIYDVQKLIDLAGSDYSTKRKLANKFIETYDYRYEELTKDKLNEVLEFQKEWLSQEGLEFSPDLKTEDNAISTMLQNWDTFSNKLAGGLIYVEDKLVAYTIAEKVDHSTIIIHFEKALYGYRGSYQAINRMFLENICCGYQYVNRQQDLGIEGLRKAKKEYHPIRFIKKYSLELKFDLQV